MTKKNDLSELQLSALREAGNIGAGHAALALSRLIGRKISVAVTDVNVAPLAVLLKSTSEKENLSAGIHLKILADIEGEVMMIFHREAALTLINLLMQREGRNTRLLGEIERSSLKEAANIVVASYLNALGEFLKIPLICSVPYLIFEKGENLVDFFKTVEKQFSRQAIGIETEFAEASHRIRGMIIFVLDKEGIEIMLKRLKVY